MKKRFMIWVLIFLLAASMLSGCGANGGSAKYSNMADAAAPQAMAEEMMWDEDLYYSAASYAGGKGNVSVPAETQAKIIYTADMDLETTDFDAAVAAIAALTEECGGYYETSNLSNGGSYRSASYTVRVPAEKYREFLSQAGELCHMLNLYEYTDDVSEVYYDTAGRLETQQIKLERLQELLGQAKKMEDIITIENAISETEETIDRLSGQLRHYDALVDYSTVSIYLREVYRLSNVEEPVQGFGSRIAAAFKSGWSGFVAGMEGLLIALAYGWMWLVLLAVIVTVIVLLARRSAKRRAARPRPAPTAYTTPAAYTPPAEKKEE